MPILDGLTHCDIIRKLDHMLATKQIDAATHRAGITAAKIVAREKGRG
jgi:hypothetical protein